jgi:hypothetical protein
LFPCLRRASTPLATFQGFYGLVGFRLLLLENRTDRRGGDVHPIVAFPADLHASKQYVIGRILQPDRACFRLGRLNFFARRPIVREALDHLNATAAPVIDDQRPDPPATSDLKEPLLTLFCVSSHPATLLDENQHVSRLFARQPLRFSHHSPSLPLSVNNPHRVFVAELVIDLTSAGQPKSRAAEYRPDASLIAPSESLEGDSSRLFHKRRLFPIVKSTDTAARPASPNPRRAD